MRITLCGSARFEKEFKDWNRWLTLAGHVVYSLAVYPSDMSGGKDWYGKEEKAMLDQVHKLKIDNSDAIVVITGAHGHTFMMRYVGESTHNEVNHAIACGKKVYFTFDNCARELL